VYYIGLLGDFLWNSSLRFLSLRPGAIERPAIVYLKQRLFAVQWQLTDLLMALLTRTAWLCGPQERTPPAT